MTGHHPCPQLLQPGALPAVTPGQVHGRVSASSRSKLRGGRSEPSSDMLRSTSRCSYKWPNGARPAAPRLHSADRRSIPCHGVPCGSAMDHIWTIRYKSPRRESALARTPAGAVREIVANPTDLATVIYFMASNAILVSLDHDDPGRERQIPIGRYQSDRSGGSGGDLRPRKRTCSLPPLLAYRWRDHVPGRPERRRG